MGEPIHDWLADKKLSTCGSYAALLCADSYENSPKMLPLNIGDYALYQAGVLKY